MNTTSERKRHASVWWMTGKLPRLLVPYSWRRRRFYRLQIRDIKRELDKHHDAMMLEMEQREHDPDGGLSVLNYYEDRVTRSASNRLAALQNQLLLDRALHLGIEVAASDLWEYSDEHPDGIPNEAARRKLARDVREEHWRQGQRIANVITPILSLLVALTALLLTRACPTPPHP